MEGEELGLMVNFIHLFSSLVLYAMPSYSIDPRSPALSSVAAEATAVSPLCRCSIVDIACSKSRRSQVAKA